LTKIICKQFFSIYFVVLILVLDKLIQIESKQLKQEKIKNKYIDNYKSTTCIQLKNKSNAQDIKSNISNYKSNMQKRNIQISNKSTKKLFINNLYIYSKLIDFLQIETKTLTLILKIKIKIKINLKLQVKINLKINLKILIKIKIKKIKLKIKKIKLKIKKIKLKIKIKTKI